MSDDISSAAGSAPSCTLRSCAQWFSSKPWTTPRQRCTPRGRHPLPAARARPAPTNDVRANGSAGLLAEQRAARVLDPAQAVALL
ncbi:hypothetical protein [Streptomyces sp. NPDC001165]|uniref:hypothetical protein n=1 Tax=Streptomyces sp. NPDC001165 TaxID=3364546 RepID=UPI0036C3B1FB